MSYITRTSQSSSFSGDPHYLNRRFWRNPFRLSPYVAIQHEVADHQYALPRKCHKQLIDLFMTERINRQRGLPVTHRQTIHGLM
jgi:hypothetical protein